MRRSSSRRARSMVSCIATSRSGAGRSPRRAASGRGQGPSRGLFSALLATWEASRPAGRKRRSAARSRARASGSPGEDALPHVEAQRLFRVLPASARGSASPSGAVERRGPHPRAHLIDLVVDWCARPPRRWRSVDHPPVDGHLPALAPRRLEEDQHLGERAALALKFTVSRPKRRRKSVGRAELQEQHRRVGEGPEPAEKDGQRATVGVVVREQRAGQIILRMLMTTSTANIPSAVNRSSLEVRTKRSPSAMSSLGFFLRVRWTAAVAG